MTAMTEALLTIRDVARLLNVSERTVFRLIERGEITGMQLGGGGKGRVWRFPPSEVDAYVERQKEKREKETPPA
jgi:excisionase family DNA binding protein